MAFPLRDTLDAVLIGCFLFGILFTVASLALGFADLGHGGDNGDVGGHEHEGPLAFISLSSVLAFLTWFGGVGYLVRNALNWWTPLSLVAGIVAGLAGAAAVGWAVKRVLRSSGGALNPDDYRLVGMIGRVTSSIRPDGFGEIVYEQAGTRHVAAARAAGADGIARGVEVIVLRLERGVAIVQPWDELLAMSGQPAAPAPDLETVERERR